MNLESLYLRLPLRLQNLAIGLEGGRVQRRRYGAGFDHIQGEVQSREHLTDVQLEAYRIERLRQHLRIASQTPYWRQRFADHGIDASTSEPFTALSKLPILTKNDVKDQCDKICNPALSPKQLLSVHTSGTTGSGLVFWQTREMEQVTWATWWRYRRWHGLRRGDWCAYFGGRSVVPLPQNTPPFWRRNNPGQQLLFSGYHLSPSTASDYARSLCDSEIGWLHGYPSMLALLATLILELHLSIPKIKIVTVGAENLLAAQEAVIAEAFNAPVVQHYGQAEGVANFSECPMGRIHVDEDYAGVEFVPLDDDPNLFRVVGTNWHNQAFPLLRYDTGDLVELQKEGACNCGRPGRLVKVIDGRREDYLQLNNGAQIGRLDHVFKDMVNVREAQIVQRSDGRIGIRIVRGSRYTHRDEEILLREFRQRVGNEASVTIEYLPHIVRTKSGKLRLVVRE